MTGVQTCALPISDNITLILAKIVGPTLVSKHEESEPITLGAVDPTWDPSLVFWIAMAVCGLAAPVLLLTGNAIAGYLAVVLAGICALLAWLLPKLLKKRGVALKLGQQLGGGPYTKSACPAGDRVGQLLARILRDLPKSVEQQGYDIDLTEFESHCKSAERAQTAGNLQDAMIRRARGIRVLMHAVREAQNKDASDSAMEL